VLHVPKVHSRFCATDGCTGGIPRLTSGTGNLRCSDHVSVASGLYGSSRPSQPGHCRAASLLADLTCPTGLTALSHCARPEGDADSLEDASVADTEASQASALLVCLLLALDGMPGLHPPVSMPSTSD
jgi:hypothetical protein